MHGTHKIAAAFLLAVGTLFLLVVTQDAESQDWRRSRRLWRQATTYNTCPTCRPVSQVYTPILYYPAQTSTVLPLVESTPSIELSGSTTPQNDRLPGDMTEVRRSVFHRSMLQAIVRARQDDKITRRDAVRLRVALWSPAFRDAAEDLAIIQMAFSGDAGVPVNDDGSIDRSRIDWEALLSFLERLLPLILQLINGLG